MKAQEGRWRTREKETEMVETSKTTSNGMVRDEQVKRIQRGVTKGDHANDMKGRNGRNEDQCFDTECNKVGELYRKTKSSVQMNNTKMFETLGVINLFGFSHREASDLPFRVGVHT